jgi:uracil phosphoribosyltransferase
MQTPAAALRPTTIDDAHLHVLPQTRHLRALHTTIRDRTAPREEFVQRSGRIIRLLLEAALDLLPFEDRPVTTPVGQVYPGIAHAVPFCGVSVARAGESMEAELRAVCPEVRIGKILIQRDKVTKQPEFLRAWLPVDVAQRHVLLLDPMFATGGTVLAAIDVLREHGVAEESIVFVSMLAAPEGLAALRARQPRLPVVTSAVEERLNENAYMVPGVGDFGDRFFGTDAPAASHGELASTDRVAVADAPAPLLFPGPRSRGRGSGSRAA